ncbi:transposase-like protein [Actinoplanes lutulentus]|uniref:helix-turn-helix domain-containing protein n=1 Tax=Actinoplanes lutulentus TaxID=1287878 RepID=UPI00182A735C|nr:helix-turn-helix domain-containing protein [Actinoplanes lutulentus]MBB2941945.1 transposase-like protein [Actinoplanes lutulentus]
MTDADRQRVVGLHAKGKSRNAIATELGRSSRTISKICAEHDPPLSFERTRTAAATAAKKADGAALRAELQLNAPDAAGKLMAQMFAPTKVFNFGGKENDYNEVQHDEPPFHDKRDIATAIQALANTALKLAEYDKATGHEDDRSMLTDLREALIEALIEARTRTGR